MYGKCDSCSEVYNITTSPNKIEGFFITEELYDVRQSELWDEVVKEEGNEKIYCQKCPKCGNITRIN